MFTKTCALLKVGPASCLGGGVFNFSRVGLLRWARLLGSFFLSLSSSVLINSSFLIGVLFSLMDLGR